MTTRLSTGLRNSILTGQGFASAMNKCFARIYSGTQPASADSAATGTLLGIVSNASGAVTLETRAVGTITITAAASGSINSITVGATNIIPDGAVAAVAADTTGTAAALCEAINRNGLFIATQSANVVSITPPAGSGAAFNSVAVSGTLTTVTATYGNMSAAGVAPVNGLMFGAPVNGVIGKSAQQVWSFNGITTGIAGWIRFAQSNEDGGGASTTANRIDMAVATSGAEVSLSNISLTSGAPNTVDSVAITMPAA